MQEVRPQLRLTLLRGVIAVGLPLVITYVLLTLVITGYESCTGSDIVATTYRFRQFFWSFALPAGGYAAAYALRKVTGWRGLAATATRSALGTGLVGVLYLYLSIRYFHIDQNSCVDGLPAWWPRFLAARG